MRRTRRREVEMPTQFIDDDEVFIGIVKRKDVLQYYIGQAKEEV